MLKNPLEASSWLIRHSKSW